MTVITKTPSFTPTREFSLGRGNFESTDAQADFSTGLTETVAADISALYHNAAQLRRSRPVQLLICVF